MQTFIDPRSFAEQEEARHPSGGDKHDNGKLRMDLIPPEAEHALAAVLTHGAKKYADHNWEKGIAYSRVYGAIRRHLLAWVEAHQGDDDYWDSESGLPHLWHAFCELAFLITYEARGMSEKWDDIPKGE